MAKTAINFSLDDEDIAELERQVALCVDADNRTEFVRRLIRRGRNITRPFETSDYMIRPKGRLASANTNGHSEAQPARVLTPFEQKDNVEAVTS